MLTKIARVTQARVLPKRKIMTYFHLSLELSEKIKSFKVATNTKFLKYSWRWKLSYIDEFSCHNTLLEPTQAFSKVSYHAALLGTSLTTQAVRWSLHFVILIPWSLYICPNRSNTCVCYVSSSASGQDEVNPMFWLANRADKMGLRRVDPARKDFVLTI